MSRGLLLSRKAVAFDRVVLLVLAVLFVGGGALFFLDRAGQVPVEAGPVLEDAATGPDQSWWPWAVAGLGVVLVLLGLKWLLSHLPVGRQGPVSLEGGDASGRLRADLGQVASAAADRLSSAWGVASASGRCIAERGRPVIELSVAVSPDVAPTDVRPALDSVLAELVRSAGAEVPVRVELTVARARSGNKVARVS